FLSFFSICLGWTYIYIFIFQIALFKTLLEDNLPRNISKSHKGGTATASPTTSKSFDWPRAKNKTYKAESMAKKMREEVNDPE
ncbi:hypothetical protein M5D96_010629, partial [Drosophila gunungcola]